AAGHAWLVSYRRDRADAGGSLFRHRQLREPDLEPVDAATVVGGIRRLTSDSASEAEERVRMPRGGRTPEAAGPKRLQGPRALRCLNAASTIWCVPVWSRAGHS